VTLPLIHIARELKINADRSHLFLGDAIAPSASATLVLGRLKELRDHCED
jgi:hypothetical protein